MTRAEFEIFKSELMERFVCIYSKREFTDLKEKGYRFLYRCTHFKTGRYFWIYDRTDSIVKDIAEFRNTNKKDEEVTESIANES